MSGDIFACYNRQVDAVPGSRPEMSPTILQSIGQVLQQLSNPKCQQCVSRNIDLHVVLEQVKLIDGDRHQKSGCFWEK